MPLDDLVFTIDSDAEEVVEVPKLEAKVNKKGTSKSKSNESNNVASEDKDALNPDFTFDLGEDIYEEVLNGKDALGDLIKGSKRVSAVFIFCLRSLN